MTNYFMDRKKIIKIKVDSDEIDTKLMPQGSVFGSLLFLIYVNDLSFTLELVSKLFADDTTLYDASDNIEVLIASFIKKLDLLLEWCKFNKLDINFKKTYFMFITRKRVVIPKSIKVNNIDIDVVPSFRQLGITIGNMRSFY